MISKCSFVVILATLKTWPPISKADDRATLDALLTGDDNQAAAIRDREADVSQPGSEGEPVIGF
jgi:hypothetical protein